MIGTGDDVELLEDTMDLKMMKAKISQNIPEKRSEEKKRKEKKKKGKEKEKEEIKENKRK